jgi:hypothetical protein
MYIRLILLTLILSSCSSGRKPEEFNKEEVISEVRIMMDLYFNAVNENGLTAEFEFLDNSDDFFWVPPGYGSALSYDSVYSILSGNAPHFNSVTFEWERLSLLPLSKELVNYTGIVQSTMEDTTGKINHFKLIETGLLIKREDGWKLLSGQSRILESG